MMKWLIPAKTFLVGEYVALIGGPAIVLTSAPYFEVLLTDYAGLEGIHPESPAGRWWLAQCHERHGLRFQDPYHGKGGLGASSAQFVGAYLAHHHLLNKPVIWSELLKAYLHVAWNGMGVPPSGYDVQAQYIASLQPASSSDHFVYINREQGIEVVYTWPFNDLTYNLVRTGQKLPTHDHLQTLSKLNDLDKLASIVEQMHRAFVDIDSSICVQTIRDCHQQLNDMGLVAPHTLDVIHQVESETDVLAVKGCGALGADILFVLLAC